MTLDNESLDGTTKDISRHAKDAAHVLVSSAGLELQAHHQEGIHWINIVPTAGPRVVGVHAVVLHLNPKCAKLGGGKVCQGLNIVVGGGQHADKVEEDGSNVAIVVVIVRTVQIN